MPSYPLHLTQIGNQTVSYRLLGTGPRRILFFHGFPGSSIQISLFESRVLPDQLTVLCLDRPGYGKSDVAPTPQIAQGIRQCQGVLAQLGWDRFEVVAVSGGAPLGLCLAHALRDRVVRTKVACGLGPLGDPRVAALMPKVARAALTLLPRVPAPLLSKVLQLSSGHDARAAARDVLLARLFFNASRPDQLVLRDAGVAQSLSQGKTEAFEQGGKGPQADAQSYLTPWDWAYSQFSGPVSFYHGLDDRVIPPAVSRYLASAIPGAELSLIEGEGHFSLPIRKLAMVLA